MALSIKWNRKAINQFDEAIEYIERHSVTNAKKAKKEVLMKIDILLKHPEKYNLDKYKTQNDGSFRAFELYRYRISYRYRGTDIRIIRIGHTKMNPLEY